MAAPLRITQIWRYPVKGLGGQQLTSTDLGRDGIALDRVLGLTHDRVPLSPFGHWTTYDAFHALDARPDLGGFSARAIDSENGAKIEVRTPRGETAAVTLDSSGAIADDSALTPGTVSRWFGTSTTTARLVSSGSHLWDLADAPISIINEASVRAVGRAVGHDLDPRRFRANLYVDSDEPWSELHLLGRTITIGGVELEVLRPIERCQAISVDPTRGGRDINLPGALYAHFGHLFCGVYARVVRTGEIHDGDPIDSDRRPQPAVSLAGATVNEARSAPRPGSISRVEAPARDAASLLIEDSTGTLSQAAPGQHLRLHGTSGERPWWRNYTISGVDARGVRITVRRLEDGLASPIVHDLRASADVLVSGPYGEATADPQGPDHLVVLTAGIGITPALSIARALQDANSDRAVDFVHVDRSREAIPHWDEIERAATALPNVRHHLFLTRSDAHPGVHHEGRPTGEFLSSLITDASQTELHVCGPATFLQDVRHFAAERGIGDDAIHADPFYSPRHDVPEPREAPRAGPFRVEFARSGQVYEWDPSCGTLLDLADKRGQSLPASCRAGACGTCAVKVTGDVFYTLEPVTPAPAGQTLICCAVPTSDVVIS
ncbi:MOSC domain-containing protein [Aeromicrobium sp. 9AM]|uniref:MOSC domain-containing protein n=1 Tax=Aeromicrobium sp. 9AM TaxID=2653126 RepID=UPI0012F089F1|nr:MOSC domain-containing protein [Aeromicrobium sp. 9AM]VXB14635.1 conserved hypothetical protein [Aeromicrobium sp. 9AM]